MIDVINDTSLVQATTRAFSCLNDKNLILKFFIYELAAPLPQAIRLTDSYKSNQNLREELEKFIQPQDDD